MKIIPIPRYAVAGIRVRVPKRTLMKVNSAVFAGDSLSGDLISAYGARDDITTVDNGCRIVEQDIRMLYRPVKPLALLACIQVEILTTGICTSDCGNWRYLC